MSQILTNEALVLQALAHNLVRSTESKSSLAFNGIPTNTAAEGVSFDANDLSTVHFTLYYPAATAVVIRLPSGEVALTKGEDGAWGGSATFPTGFHYIFILVDGQDVLSPYIPIGYGYSRPMNYVEIPPELPSGSEKQPLSGLAVPYLLDPQVPHGSVCSDFFLSSVTGRTEKLNVYLPPDYHRDACAATRYPVLYLQHGHGENENGWIFQGKVNIIADNLIFTERATPCIIVVGNGMVYEDNKTSALNYCDVLMKDVVPFIDARYRTRQDAASRAVAGLSMGSMQAARVGILHSDVFAYVGLFSGFLRCSWSTLGGDDAHMDVLANDTTAFAKHNKLFFRGIGEDDGFKNIFDEDSRILQDLSVANDCKVYKGAHTWQPWREMITEFLERLF